LEYVRILQLGIEKGKRISPDTLSSNVVLTFDSAKLIIDDTESAEDESEVDADEDHDAENSDESETYQSNTGKHEINSTNSKKLRSSGPLIDDSLLNVDLVKESTSTFVGLLQDNKHPKFENIPPLCVLRYLCGLMWDSEVKKPWKEHLDIAKIPMPLPSSMEDISVKYNFMAYFQCTTDEDTKIVTDQLLHLKEAEANVMLGFLGVGKSLNKLREFCGHHDFRSFLSSRYGSGDAYEMVVSLYKVVKEATDDDLKFLTCHGTPTFSFFRSYQRLQPAQRNALCNANFQEGHIVSGNKMDEFQRDKVKPDVLCKHCGTAGKTKKFGNMLKCNGRTGCLVGVHTKCHKVSTDGDIDAFVCDDHKELRLDTLKQICFLCKGHYFTNEDKEEVTDNFTICDCGFDKHFGLLYTLFRIIVFYHLHT
jgi:hypothetical protein